MKKIKLLVVGLLALVFTSSSAFGYSGGSGTEADPYLLASKVDLLELGSTTNDYSKHFKMISDIDLSGTNFTVAVIASDTNSASSYFQGTEFTGVFDGNSNNVLNLSISGGLTNDYIGLFGCIGQGGEVKNLGIVDCNVSSDYWVGGLCGWNNGIISFCYSTGAVNGNRGVGGLCGSTDGTIYSCYSTGTVSGDLGVGGLCGENSDGTISSCYSTGTVSGNAGAGGLCGINWIGTSSSCFWDKETSGLSTSDGGIGKTTVQMQTESTFTDAGWDFADTWFMNGYPVLIVLNTELKTYRDWLDNLGVPGNEQVYTDCPSGDGIQNLLKYAIGLNPMDVCSAQDIMEPVADENGVSIVYRKSKGIDGVDLFPIWSDSLLLSNWNPNGFEFAVIDQTDSNVTWKATHSVTGECGYIRLKAQIDD